MIPIDLTFQLRDLLCIETLALLRVNLVVFLHPCLDALPAAICSAHLLQ